VEEKSKEKSNLITIELQIIKKDNQIKILKKENEKLLE